MLFAPLGALAKANSSQDNVTAFAAQLQNAVARHNAKFLVEHIAYPIEVYFNGTKLKLYGSVGAGMPSYGYWMTPYLHNLITKTPPAKLVELLEIKKDKGGTYKVHHLLFTGDPADFRYSKDGIYSAKDLLHIIAVLKQGAKEHCAKCVAKVIQFPVTDCIGGKWVKVKDEAEFVKHYDEIVTPEVKELMLHAWDRHNWKGFPDKGIMLGDIGDIWIESFGHKNAQGFWVWETKVTALHEVEDSRCP